MSRILVVDDEPSICWGLSRLARSLGCRVDTASSAEQGLALAAAARPDLLMLDVRLPGADGLSAMRSFRMHIGDAPIVVMTAFGDLGTAVTAVESGAFEYVVKPFDLAEIRAVVERALRSAEPAASAQAPADAPPVGGMVGSTPVMHAVFKRIALAANSAAPVLLRGESGTGKEMAARAIHNHSSRRTARFVAVNVAALSPDQAEAELFGQAGLADGAPASSRTGLLAQAAGGTLFLDDVDAIPLPLQVKLLCALDQGEVTPQRAKPGVKGSLRIIAATRLDLRELVQRGDFRHDLFVRLGAYEITLPPLRERQADIPRLAQHFAAQLGSGVAVLVPETLTAMQRRPWFGNVRELRTAVEHALVVARTGAVLPSHLPDPLPSLAAADPAAGPSATSLGQAVASLANTLLENSAHTGDVYDRFLEKVEPPLLATVLMRNGNRCAPAARALGLHRTTLKRKLDQYGIDEAPGDR